ncbi:MAG: electron transport complex subunit RsxE [Gammaproteobacteria bacterium]|nr:MAG: electron transport complex subunit RsxE [Gammaproteobacteria bacterium]
MISKAEFKKITTDGFWNNNAGLVQLLGLCPLLGVTNTLINGLGLGLATCLVLLISNISVSLIRNTIKDEVRIPVFVIIIAAAVTIVELLMQAFVYNLYTVLGIFLPLITTNCAIIGRAEAFAAKNNIATSALDGLSMGLGFTAVLVVLGALRESIGQGTLFSGAHLLLGEGAKNWTITLVEHYDGFLLAILPPGAFIGMGLLIALKNLIDQGVAARAKPAATKQQATAS